MASFSSVSSIHSEDRAPRPSTGKQSTQLVRHTLSAFDRALEEVRKLTKPGEPRLITAPILEGVLEALGEAYSMDPELAQACRETASYITTFHAQKCEGSREPNPHALSHKTFKQVTQMAWALENYRPRQG